jgi:hypothetical protein
MPGSATWAFGEPKDFQAALREDGVLSFLVTAREPAVNFVTALT